MTPNFLLFPEWGKLLFSVADVGIVYLIYAVRLELEKRKPKVAQFCAHLSSLDGNSSDDNDVNCFSTSSIESDSDTNDRNDRDDRDDRSDTTHLNINLNSKNQNPNNHQNNYQNENQNRNNHDHNYNNNSRNRNNIRMSNSNKSSIRTSCSVAWLWALNPLAINICTRGSADSLTNCLVLALLFYLLQQSKKKIF